jgi:hypothetical protein
MGWYYTLGSSRKDIIDEVTEEGRNEKTGVTSTCIARYFSGNDLWTVWEQTGPPFPEPQRFICLFMLSRGRGDGWGYKPVEESCGPTAVSCPPRFLDMVPEPPNDWGRKWREGVRMYWAARRERLRARKIAQKRLVQSRRYCEL